MDDFVVDANVFAHAANPNNEYFEDSLLIVMALMDSELCLALDDTGKKSPDEWTSNLYREYTECVPPQSLSAEVIGRMLSSGRAVFHLRPKSEIWRKCKKLAPRNNNDAIVLGIGYCASTREVVSNDYDDFSHDVRKAAKKDLGVIVKCSKEFGS